VRKFISLFMIGFRVRGSFLQIMGDFEGVEAKHEGQDENKFGVHI
jgi:hypothetical protein